ncbi:MAG TPA: polyprenyl synthetase family protein [Candidatus Omnitrophota bacterium]|nr:polyprenyl synthetase family protein [Candidatus Omnitrophota bacterium]HPT07892.1 polyprenyl synthetase family protein [Candidatus Omnitrophota bacterium]
MFTTLKRRLDSELISFCRDIEKKYRLNSISPLLFQKIKEFIIRDGKRVRPILFVIGYKGFSRHQAPGLYTSALSIELLHDFMLVHDDIIDKSATRRGAPSMHTMLNNHLARHKKIKFSGQDLAIAAGDVMYAMAIDSFLSIKENMERKERALRTFIEAAIFTGSGEFIELLAGTKHIKDITQKDIYKIYDYKTAYYTFASPLASGAILGGANQKEIKILFTFGLCLGRAFQIKDDIIGMFGNEAEIGKSALTDLQEAKKTLLVWYAYRAGTAADKKMIEKVFVKPVVTKSDLETMNHIVITTGALAYAQNEIRQLTDKIHELNSKSRMKQAYKNMLASYTRKILSL